MGTVEAIKPAGTEPFAHTLPKLLNASLIRPSWNSLGREHLVQQVSLGFNRFSDSLNPISSIFTPSSPQNTLLPKTSWPSAPVLRNEKSTSELCMSWNRLLFWKRNSVQNLTEGTSYTLLLPVLGGSQTSWTTDSIQYFFHRVP